MEVSRVPLSRIQKVRLDEQIGNAFISMYKEKFDYIPVVDGNDKLIRIFSKTDLCNYLMNTINTLDANTIEENDLKQLVDKWENDALEGDEAKIKKNLDEKIENIINIEKSPIPKVDPISVLDTESVNTALNILFKEDKNSLPIVDKNNVLKGITTKSDFIQYLLKIQKEI